MVRREVYVDFLSVFAVFLRKFPSKDGHTTRNGETSPGNNISLCALECQIHPGVFLCFFVYFYLFSCNRQHLADMEGYVIVSGSACPLGLCRDSRMPDSKINDQLSLDLCSTFDWLFVRFDFNICHFNKFVTFENVCYSLSDPIIFFDARLETSTKFHICLFDSANPLLKIKNQP